MSVPNSFNDCPEIQKYIYINQIIIYFDTYNKSYRENQQYVGWLCPEAPRISTKLWAWNWWLEGYFI